jgi:hypothetical protein
MAWLEVRQQVELVAVVGAVAAPTEGQHTVGLVAAPERARHQMGRIHRATAAGGWPSAETS